MMFRADKVKLLSYKKEVQYPENGRDQLTDPGGKCSASYAHFKRPHKQIIKDHIGNAAADREDQSDGRFSGSDKKCLKEQL